MLPSKKLWQAVLEERHGRELQRRFSAATVAVCGLGGLGSHIAPTLARAGVGRLLLFDFDRVELSNLHRQQYSVSQIGRYKTEALAESIREIAPYTETILHTVRLTSENAVQLLRKADVVCEAFDDPVCKSMLAEAILCGLSKPVLVAASGMAGLGSGNRIRMRKVTERFYLCGDEVSAVTEQTCLFASRVMLCAAQQAHTVLRVLAGQIHMERGNSDET